MPVFKVRPHGKSMQTIKYWLGIVSIAGRREILFALCALALLPSAIQAECRQWDAGGNWFPQGGDDWAFHLTQKGGLLTGSARGVP